MNRFLIKIDRLAAWILLIGFVLFFITGYGMVKGFIDASWTINMHNKILPPIIMVAFVIHASYAISLAFKRWNFWNAGSKTILSLFFIAFLAFFLIINYFYQAPKNNTSTTSEQNTSGSSSKESQSSSATESNTNNTNNTSSARKTFTLDELSKYNGQNDQPAYVAVDGVVYDVSSEFTNGSHYSHLAGQDLTDQFYSYHRSSSITKYPVVGTLVK